MRLFFIFPIQKGCGRKKNMMTATMNAKVKRILYSLLMNVFAPSFIRRETSSIREFPTLAFFTHE